MFGTIRPSDEFLGNKGMTEYRKYYCGLCMGMERFSGRLSRIYVNFDLCLAYIIADSVNPESTEKQGICPFAPWRKVTYIDKGELLDSIARINFLMSYYKLKDNVLDEGSLISRWLLSMMKKKYSAIALSLPGRIARIEESLDRLHEMERANNPVRLGDAAGPFASMLETLMGDCLDEALDSQIFMKLCYWTGVWIYIVDACLDLKKDCKTGKYNPILAGSGLDAEMAARQRRDEVADILMRSRSAVFHLLELLTCCRNKELICSIFEHSLPREVADLFGEEV